MGVEKLSNSKPGDGRRFPTSGCNVIVHYTGTLPGQGDKVFDSSVSRGPFKFQVGCGNVIRGWDECIPTMSIGEKSK